MTRLVDADKLKPDCLTKEGKFAISQSQVANAPTINMCVDCATRDLYKNKFCSQCQFVNSAK